ncbi:AUGMIN subunit 4 [Orobanche gracilis]
MAKILAAQNLQMDVSQVMDQLERHCLAPDGSLVSKSTYYDLQLAREEMCKERERYLEALAVYIEMMAMIEEYQQAISVANFGGIPDVQGLYSKLGLKNSAEVYEALEHRMVVAEAAQRLRLPLISKDGEIHEEEFEKWSTVSRSSLDSTSTSITMSSSTNLTNYTIVTAAGAGILAHTPFSLGGIDTSEPEVGGVPNRFLGITPAYLWQTQNQRTLLSMDIAEYQVLLACEISRRLDAKCDKLADVVAIDDIESSTGHQNLTSRLPESLDLNISLLKLVYGLMESP